MPNHTLIWKSTGGAAPSGADGLMGWREYFLAHNPRFFRDVSPGAGAAQVGRLAGQAAMHAIDGGLDVTVAWGNHDLWSAPAEKLEPVFRQLEPKVLVLPERRGSRDRWCITNAGAVDSLPLAAAQGAVSSMVASLYPDWRRGEPWRPAALLIRHGISAEELGLVPPREPAGDDLLNFVSGFPELKAAVTLGQTVRARLAAQERAGVPADKRVPLYSGEVEEIMIPTLATIMSAAHAVEKLAQLRRALAKRYGDAATAELVLQFALRSFDWNGPAMRDLRAAAKAPIAPPAA
jgi:hypothetical protein